MAQVQHQNASLSFCLTHISNPITIFFLPSFMSISLSLLLVNWETRRAVIGLWQIRSKWPVIIFDEWPIRPDRDTDRQADACVDLNLWANVPPWQSEQITQTTHCITHQLLVLIWQMFIRHFGYCSADVSICNLTSPLKKLVFLILTILMCYLSVTWVTADKLYQEFGLSCCI